MRKGWIARHIAARVAMTVAMTAAVTAAMATLSVLPPIASTANAAPLTNVPGTASASDTDALFLRRAGTAGAMEIEASRIAEVRASSPEIKAFAKKMIEDHQAVDAQLKQIAGKLGIQVPESPLEAQQRDVRALEQLNGAAFDAAYIRKIGVDAHQDAVKLFRDAADKANHSEVKAMALRTLPSLRHHLEMANALNDKLGK